jgi:hypothetical protein
MQGVRIDMAGKTVGDVMVLKFHGTINSKAYWLCRCKCEKEFIALGTNLRRGLTKSCGCYRAVSAREVHRRHGDTDTRFYKIWCGIKVRINNENSHAYDDYGGRGITISPSWLTYENFKIDMFQSYQEHCTEFGEHHTTIDRVNTNLGYDKGNCKWSTQKEQNNNRRDNIKVTYMGVTYSRQEAAIKFGINPWTFRDRLERGWDVERALTTKGRVNN